MNYKCLAFYYKNAVDTNLTIFFCIIRKTRMRTRQLLSVMDLYLHCLFMKIKGLVSHLHNKRCNTFKFENSNIQISFHAWIFGIILTLETELEAIL